MGYITHADCSGLEPRIIADRTDCKFLKSIFLNPATSRKIYIIAGEPILQCKIVKGTVEYDTAKETILATNYNAMARTLQGRLKLRGIFVTQEQCETYIERYFRKAPELKDYIYEQKYLVARDQKITCLTGYVNELPNDGPDSKGFKHEWNRAVNIEIQHLASVIAFLWLNHVQRIMRKEGLTARHVRALRTVFMGPVHDSLTHDVKERNVAERILKIYEEALVEVQGEPMVRLIGRPLTVPLEVDTKLVESWDQAK